MYPFTSILLLAAYTWFVGSMPYWGRNRMPNGVIVTQLMTLAVAWLVFLHDMYILLNRPDL